MHTIRFCTCLTLFLTSFACRTGSSSGDGGEGGGSDSGTQTTGSEGSGSEDGSDSGSGGGGSGGDDGSSGTGGSGGDVPPELEPAATVLSLLIPDPADVDRILGSGTVSDIGNPHVHGTCETVTDVVPGFDIVGSFGVTHVPATSLDLDADVLNQCGNVGGSWVFCPQGGAAFNPGELVLVAGYVTNGLIDLGRPDARTQISTTFEAEGSEVWEPLAQYMCDYWGGMSHFVFANLESDAGGALSGSAELGNVSGGTIGSLPSTSRIIVNGSTAVSVTPQSDLPRAPRRYRVGLDGGMIGSFQIADWHGGDTDPPMDGPIQFRSTFQF